MCVTVTDWIRFSNNLRLRANKSAISVITYDYLLEMIMTCKTEADKYKRMADSSMKNHSLSVRDASKMIVKFRAEIRELQDTIDAQRLESMKFKEKAMKEKKAFEKALKRRRKVITNVIEKEVIIEKEIYVEKPKPIPRLVTEKTNSLYIDNHLITNECEITRSCDCCERIAELREVVSGTIASGIKSKKVSNHVLKQRISRINGLLSKSKTKSSRKFKSG